MLTKQERNEVYKLALKLYIEGSKDYDYSNKIRNGGFVGMCYYIDLAYYEIYHTSNSNYLTEFNDSRPITSSMFWYPITEEGRIQRIVHLTQLIKDTNNE